MAAGTVETYGRLTEGIHISGYTFERACTHLEWLLEDDRWKACGDFRDVNAFLDSLRLDQFRTVAETRKRIAERIKKLQPAVSNRQIARTLGVGETTVRRDTAPNGAPADQKARQTADSTPRTAPNGAPPTLTGEAAAQAALKAAQRDENALTKGARREEREAELVEKTERAGIKLNSGKLYNVIYADPPWRFEPYSRQTGMDRAADNHYPTMTVEALKALQIPAAADCALLMWATAPMLSAALGVIEAWGFTYKSHCVWAKLNRDGRGLHRGTGYWFANAHELLLVATRGSVPAPPTDQKALSVFSLPVGEHSAKPDLFAAQISAWYPSLAKLEMFARQIDDEWTVDPRNDPAAGWDRWGNEA